MVEFGGGEKFLQDLHLKRMLTCAFAHVGFQIFLRVLAQWVGFGKDTALAWLMPTNTAMQRMTLAHSRLNLCGSPRWLSRYGYNKPTTAAETKRQNVSTNQLRCAINSIKLISAGDQLIASIVSISVKAFL